MRSDTASLGFGASPKEAVTWEQACAKLGAAGEEGGWLTGRRVTAHQWRWGLATHLPRVGLRSSTCC